MTLVEQHEYDVINTHVSPRLGGTYRNQDIDTISGLSVIPEEELHYLCSLTECMISRFMLARGGWN